MESYLHIVKEENMLFFFLIKSLLFYKTYVFDASRLSRKNKLFANRIRTQCRVQILIFVLRSIGYRRIEKLEMFAAPITRLNSKRRNIVVFILQKCVSIFHSHMFSFIYPLVKNKKK